MDSSKRVAGRKRCACMIHASGTLGGRFKRRSAEKLKWEEAIPIVAAWQATRTWETEPSTPDAKGRDECNPAPGQSTKIEQTEAQTGSSTPPVVHPEQMTVVAATKANLSKCASREIRAEPE